MIFENIEGLEEWNIPADHLEGREPGISAFLRVRDEAEYIEASIASIAGWVDEIVVALQAEQSDGTDEIVARLAAENQKIRVLEYPFESLPNGPGHGDQPRGSVHERAYFYNWALAQTRHEWALKWDGDMVALDEAVAVLRDVPHTAMDGAAFHGVEIAQGADGLHLAANRRTASDPRLFRVTAETFYETGPMCEVMHLRAQRIYFDSERPLYLHFKWAKDLTSALQAWPENWAEHEHFRTLFARRQPAERYTGPVPSALLGGL